MQGAIRLIRQRWVRFIIAGAANTLVSQGLLLVLLGLIPVGLATLISQLVHACCGYNTSAKGVFRSAGSPWRYGALFGLSWLLQWVILLGLLRAGLQQELAVLLLVPVLATTSYLLQKRWVFR